MNQVRSQRTGVNYTPGRDQPYTVWFKGETIGFYKTETEAVMKLQREQKRAKGH